MFKIKNQRRSIDHLVVKYKNYAGRRTPHTQGHEMRVSDLILFQLFQLQENKFVLYQINVTLQHSAPSETKGQEKIKTRMNNPCHRPSCQR